MKTKFSKFLFLLWLFNLSNAYSQYDYIENLKKNSLKIQSAKIKSCNEKLENNNKGLRYYREYDTQERIVYLNNWYNGQLQFERKYFYDEKGNLIKMDNDKDKPYNIYYAYYEYDERGLLIGEIRQSKHNKDRPPLTFKFIYDENLNLTQEIFEQGNSDFYTYENNRRIKKEEIELNGSVYSITNYYYENNSIVEEEINSDGIITRYYEKIFNLDGNLIEMKGYDGEKTLIYNIIYENDRYGNPLKTYSTRKDGKNIEIKEFLYEYYE